MVLTPYGPVILDVSHFHKTYLVNQIPPCMYVKIPYVVRSKYMFKNVIFFSTKNIRFEDTISLCHW